MINFILFQLVMRNESLFNLENGVADCARPFIDGRPIGGLYEIAQDANCLRQLVHEEIMVRTQSLNR